MNSQVSIFRNSVLAITAIVAIGAASTAAAGVVSGGRVSVGGYHAAGYGGAYHGWGGYYSPWRAAWAGWGWGLTAVGLGWYAPVQYVPAQYMPVQYAVVDPPSAGTTPVNSASSPRGESTGNAQGAQGGRWTDLFAYPKGGQSTEQQMRDREECRKWAVEQSGFDPAQPTHDNANEWTAKRESYLRAEAACLQARNYSVK